MSRDITVIPFRQPEAIDDPLTEVAREGARRMLAQVLIAEAHSFVALWKDFKLPDGRDRVVVMAMGRIGQSRNTRFTAVESQESWLKGTSEPSARSMILRVVRTTLSGGGRLSPGFSAS
jgi:hypothetical protein